MQIILITCPHVKLYTVTHTCKSDRTYNSVAFEIAFGMLVLLQYFVEAGEHGGSPGSGLSRQFNISP